MLFKNERRSYLFVSLEVRMFTIRASASRYETMSQIIGSMLLIERYKLSVDAHFIYQKTYIDRKQPSINDRSPRVGRYEPSKNPRIYIYICIYIASRINYLPYTIVSSALSLTRG